MAYAHGFKQIKFLNHETGMAGANLGHQRA